ncbi:MAG: hypothetical protein ACREO3_06195 [Arenimonas sp.]
MTDCQSSELRQFDFWLGHWTVTANGEVTGDSRIESILDGCAVLEHWTGAKGGRGKSLNVYNRAQHAWEQFWIDNQGDRLLLRGGLRDGAMVLDNVHEAGPGVRRERIAWTRVDDGSVRQLWESSSDAGATWKVEFDGLYTRVMDVDRVD